MDRLYYGDGSSRGIYRGTGAGTYGQVGTTTGYGAPYDDIDTYGDLMEISSHCSRFERRGDFDLFSMSDYQSCENCRHLGHDDRCMVK